MMTPVASGAAVIWQAERGEGAEPDRANRDQVKVSRLKA